MLELHCHTTFSDGTLTPTQLVNAASRAGVKALGITDHDTLAGWDEATAAAQDHGVEIVPGLELSTIHRGRSLHILGFYPDAVQLAPALKERIEGRKRRARQMAEKLAALGYPIALPEMPGNSAPGRPHIALALVKAGHVNSCQEAVDRLIGDDKPGYVEYDALSIEDGIALLRSCGAVPVWAHAYIFRGGTVEETLPELMDAGLMGLEIHHPEHSPSQVRRLQELSQQHGLLMTGGADFHGPKPDTKDKKADTQLNQFNLPLSLLVPIKQAAQELRGHHPIGPGLL